MAIIQIPAQDELVQEGWARVSSALGLTNNSESSVALAIIRVMSAYIFELYNELAFVSDQANLSTAVGENLDRIGRFFGVPRLQAQAATTLGGAPSVQFTNNGAVSQLIPQNTRVWAATDVDLAFFTTA